jgi:A/G-specific adenine glycosylase
MLQQTQVKTVIPYYERFLKRFPNVAALAEADEQDVLAAWSGLGYYRRAKALHRAARTIMREHEGGLPTTYEAWLALPGIGRYTAGAIMSIAYGEPFPILDGNVSRVLARFHRIHGDLRSSRIQKDLWKKAKEILPNRSVSDFNQGLMELGALVCTPKKPRCLVCPIEEDCMARRGGLENVLPEPTPRAKTVVVTMAAAVVKRGERVLMYRRQSEELMRDLWELPGGACRQQEQPTAGLVREVRERYGLELEPTREITKIGHSITNRKITLHAFEARLKGRIGRRSSLRTWIEPAKVDTLPVSSMTLKVLKRLD